MQIYIAGSGKLAQELLQAPGLGAQNPVLAWPGQPEGEERAIVVHAGSGREISDISRFCARTSSVLVELATGSSLETAPPNHPVVLCPNTNILMLKFMLMLERSGGMFAGSQISVLESHQASKTSVPGTAVSIAKSLGVAPAQITSVRDAARQVADLNIPRERLARHAFHQILIRDDSCTIAMETRVDGEAPYARGVGQIIAAIQRQNLAPRIYSITEFIENAWI